MRAILKLFIVLLVVFLPERVDAGIFHTRGRDDSLSYANANAVAGDIVYVEAGTYTVPIAPAHSGSSGSRITYIGNKAAPTAATVAGIYPAYNPDSHNYDRGDYVTVKWVASSTSIGCGYYLKSGTWTVARNDSLVKIAAAGGLSLLCRYSVFDSLTCTVVNDNAIDSNMNLGSNQGDDSDTRFLRAAGNTVKNCTFNVTTSTSSGDIQVVHLFKTSYNTFWRNTFNITCNGTGSGHYFFPFEAYFTYSSLFQENTFNVVMNATPSGTHALLAYRDSTSNCRWVRNTFNVSGPAPMSLGLAQSGTLSASTHHNCLDGNTIRIQTAEKGGFWSQNGLRADTVQFNVVRVGNSTPAFSMDGPDSLTNCVFRHNTFYTTGPNVAVSVGNTTAMPTYNTRWVSNIAYVRNGTLNGSVAIVPTALALDSAGVFYSVGGSSAKAIQRGATLGAPGAGGGFGAATTSLWGDPAFTDPNPTTFDPRPLPTSAALTATLQDGYAGAIPDTSGPHATSWAVASDSALAVAMAGAKAGDVVKIANGTYLASNFVPAAGGNSTNGLVRIVGNVSRPDSVIVSGDAAITQNNLSLSGLTFKGATYFSTATRDSIASCVFTAPYGFAAQIAGSATGLVLRSNTFYTAGAMACWFSGSSIAPTSIRGNVFASRPYMGHCTSASFIRGAGLIVPAAVPVNSDSNYFATSILDKAATTTSSRECWTLAQWQAATGNDTHSVSVVFSGATFADARQSVLDLRPASKSTITSTAAPGGHYGALTKKP